LAFIAAPAAAREIRIGPNDGGYAEIEAAQAGDEVIIAAGTYRYRVQLNQSGTESMPIVVRGEDPANPPVFDYEGQQVQQWPGSYPQSAPDAVRHAWLISGSYVTVQDVEVRGASNTSASSLSTAGFRLRNQTSRVTRVRSIGNQIGVEFGGSGGNIERSLLANNKTSVAHYGGNATIRQTLMRDAEEHVYSSASKLTLEASWLERVSDYFIVVAECSYECGGVGTQPVARSVALSGNIFRRSPSTLANFTVLLDARTGGPSLDGTGHNQVTQVYVVHNTFVGAEVIPPREQDALVAQGSAFRFDVHAWNNAVDGFDDAWASSGSATLDGGANWSTTGTAGLLPGTQLGAAALFVDAGALDFRPAVGSPLRGLAVSATVYAPIVAPSAEPPRDSSALGSNQPRVAWADVGAFEFVPPSQDGGEGSLDGGDVLPRPRGLPGWAVGCRVLPPDALGWAVLVVWGCRRSRRRSATAD
jgi:hypothetical protein